MSMYKQGGGAEVFDSPEPLATIPQQLAARKAAAASDHLVTLQRALNDAIGNVQIATPGRDGSTNGRFRYERNYQRMRQAARQVVLATGANVSVPQYLPPPSVDGTTSATLGPEDFPEHVADDSFARARREAEATNAPRPGLPGSAENDAWLSYQGDTK